MGTDPNRSGEHTNPDHNDAPRTQYGLASPAVAQAAAGSAGQSAHAIEPITMRVPDACRYIGISRSTLYLLIAGGHVETIKLGSSTLVLTASLKALVERRRGVMPDSSVQIET